MDSPMDRGSGRSADARARRAARGRLTAALSGRPRLRALLGPRHRPAAGLPRQLPADRAGAHLPAVPRAPAATATACRRSTGRSTWRRSRRARRGRSSISRRSSIAPPIRTHDRHRARRGRHPARARGDAPHRRLDSAGHRDRFHRSTRSTGPLLDRVGLGILAHRGYDLDRLVGTLYMTLEGIFGVPLDVAATYIILFTIYGAVLDVSGAGKFFLDWSLAAIGASRPRRGPGPHGHARRLPARHRLGQRRRHDGDAGFGGLAAAAARRLPAGDGRRDPVGRRHRRDLCRRRRSARPRSSSRSSCRSRICRCSSWRRSRRCSTTSRSS